MSARRDGFSLVEVIVAMIILSVGILTMGASTGYVLNQIRAAEFRTDRMTAVHHVAERLRAVPWDDLEMECGFGPFSADDYTVACSVALAPGTINLKQIQLISTGPGFTGGRLVPAVTDTMLIALAKPIGS
jgi:prepilin-type N-terminal cleavage/methylation domain-containing protein